jgi:hypothetical protein
MSAFRGLRSQRKIGGHWRFESHLTAGGRMSQANFPGMEKLAGKVRASAVCPVARDRVSEVFEVDADLVRSSGFRAALE